VSAPTLDQPTVRIDFGDRGRRRSRRLRILGILLAALALAGGVWLVWFSSMLSVTSVRVVGVEGPAAEAVLAAAAVPLNVPLARVDATGAQAAVLGLTWVADAEVRRGWPHEVVLAVVPRTPIAVLTAGRAVDADGVAFDATVKPTGLPTVRADGVGLTAAMAVLAALPADLATKVVSLSATTRDDVDLRFRSGATVHWGSAERPDLKAAVLRALLRRKAEVYDVSAPELPTTYKPAN
jgi:cell division protein FtsQ